jgi:hypothetical protein
MATTRKTAKYYREQLVHTHNPSDLEKLIGEICTKFGGKYKTINLWKRVEFNWNHRVEEFRVFGNDGRVSVKVYWQGDSTDGDDYVYLNDVLRKGTHTIKAEHFWDGYRTCEVHSDIRVEREEVESLIKELAKWLSPEEIKERKISAQISEIHKEIDSKLGNDYYRRYASKGWGSKNEEYYNGFRAVKQLIKGWGKEILKMSKEDIFKAVDKVFHANYKTDYYFGKNWNGDLTKPYDLSY